MEYKGEQGIWGYFIVTTWMEVYVNKHGCLEENTNKDKKRGHTDRLQWETELVSFLPQSSFYFSLRCRSVQQHFVCLCGLKPGAYLVGNLYEMWKLSRTYYSSAQQTPCDSMWFMLQSWAHINPSFQLLSSLHICESAFDSLCYLFQHPFSFISHIMNRLI